MQVRVDVLGPLRLWVNSAEVDVPGPKRRALLALLTVAEGHAVTIDDLIDALWPGDQPDTARSTLQSHVSRLRRHLGVASGRLEGLSGGYRLALGPDETDLGQARTLLATARSEGALEAGRLLAEARGLWRGEPLAEFADVAPLMASAVTLDELRRVIEESTIKTLQGVGDHEHAVAIAGEYLVADPLSESPVLLLMRSLHALGRSADGLRAAYEYRQRLRSEVGLDPTPALAAVEAELAAAASPPAGTVPRSPHPLRGRDSELAALRRLLTAERVVTVVGPGGVGKTRLAAEVAAGVEPATAVLLGATTDERAVPQVLADALDLRVLHGDVLSACAAVLAAGPRLLFVDNCEHLLAGVREVVGRLVAACPQLTVLTTSREPLGLPEEQRFRLAPLPMSPARPDEDVSRSPAVAVFVDRATRVRPDLMLGPDDLATVTEIVRRLDGMPLAIELAASRLSSLGLQELHTRLEQSLDLLGDDDRLRRTIAWSYDLLSDDEQRVLRHFAVFADGLDLATAEAIASDLVTGSPLPTLTHLVDVSMLEMSGDSTTRYRMLETVRAFAAEQLADRGESPRATERFLQWVLELVSWIGNSVYTADERAADRALRREIANLRAGWACVRSLARTGDAVSMILGLADAASWRDVTEIWEWNLDLAADSEIRAHPEGATILGLAAVCAWFRGEVDRAESLALAGLELADGADWACVDAQSLVALSRGEFEAAVSHAVAAGEHAPRPIQSFGVAALAAAYGGDLAAARNLNARFQGVAVSPTLEAFHAYIAGEINGLDGRRGDAIANYEAAIERSRPVGSTFVEGIASVGRLSQMAAAGETARVLAGYRDLVDYWDRTGSWVQQWTTLRNLADVLESVDDHGSARFLRQAADAAPDAPADPSSASMVASDADVATIGRSSTGAPVAGRARVLQVARAAIDSALSRSRPR